MKYAFKKARRIRIYNIATSQHKVTLNDLKTVQFTDGQDTVYAEGTDGAKLASFDQNKVASMTATNGAIETGYIAMSVGSDVEKVTNGSAIMIREEKVLTEATKFTLKHKAAGAVGNELKFIYAVDVNGNPEKAYAQGSAASATEFAFAAATKEVTLPTGVFKVGDTVIVDYCPTFSEYEMIKNDADKFSMTGKIIVDAWFTDLCTQSDVPLMLVMERGKISGAMDLSFGDQAAVQNISIESVTGACAGASKNLWTLYNYDMDKIVDT